MKTNQTTRELYQSHAKELVSLGYQSLTDIAQHSFATFRQACRSVLSWSESRSIYVQAQRHVAGLSAQRRKILTHANPQLKNALHLANNPMQQQTRDYEALFRQRADVYTTTSSVASMFSPAAYLTELYREGKQLHTSDKHQYLDKRRPDLQRLLLSQSNQDAELTTLALSNDILLSTIKTSTNQTDTQLRENLNDFAYPFDLPYHIPFASIETALAVNKTSFEALAHALARSQISNSFPVTTRAAFANHLPPGLCSLLLAPIPSNTADLNDQLMYHFGTSDIGKLSDAEYFCQRVGLSRKELNAFLSLPSFQQSPYTQANRNVKVPLLQPPHAFGGKYLNATSQQWLGFQNGIISKVVVSASSQIMEALNILPSIKDSCITFAALSKIVSNVPSTHVDIYIDDVHFTKNFPDSFSDAYVASVPLHNGYRVFEFKVTKNQFKLQVGIGDQNIHQPGEWVPSPAVANNFSVTFSPVGAADLIKLSQLIRYSQKTNLSPATLDCLIALSQGSSPPAITNATLQLTALVLEYQQRYALSEDDALVLAGADINAYAPAGELSQFDRLFNNPPLNNVAFTTDNNNDTISFAPTDTTHTLNRAVLKRALGVDDAGLATLAAIVVHDDDAWARSLTNLSTLYRVGLWARLHGLSPQELQLLLKLNGKTQDLFGQTHDITSDYLDAVYNTSEWLAAQKLSVAELNVMTTKAYPNTMTPEIDSFVRTLYPVLKEEVAETINHLGTQTTRSTHAHAASPAPLHQQLAPYLVGAFSLDSVESAIAVQVWIEQVAADQDLDLISMANFCDVITDYCETDSPSDQTSAQLATFCQALGQLAFIIKREKMSAAELNVVVYQPKILGGTLADKLSLSLETMQLLSGLSTLLLRVGEGASECLTLLGSNKLSTVALARLLNVPQSEVKLAALSVGVSENIMMDVKLAVFVLNWLAQAATLGVSVKAVRDLLNSRLEQSYSAWASVASTVQAGVVDPKRGKMNTALDEALSTALSAYFMRRVAPTLDSSIPMQNRDDLFSYLLIDNQVGGKVITSQIAEAISSVQLYINRCLQGLEGDIDTNQLTKGFFVQWQQYNRRYSTWAGVSQLAFYPENYIDPTLRYNQSNLQRQLMDELNQSQLDKDSVETAYRNYLDGFEDIANLKVLCGYHHGASLLTGMSYFVGCTNETPARYYWRSLNLEATDGLGGYVASAWTDWEEISGLVDAVNDEVRPVLFNNRLYIGSIIEETLYNEVTEGTEVTSDAGPIQQPKVQYSLQLTYQKINGNWAPMMKFVLPNIPDGLFNTTTKQPKFNLYLSYHPVYDAIVFMLYDPSLNVTAYNGPAHGGFIYNNMQLSMIESASDWTNIYALFSNNLNNTLAPNKVIRYINAQSYNAVVTNGNANNTADTSRLVISDVKIDPITVESLSVPPELSYTAKANINIISKATEPTLFSTPGDISDNSSGEFTVTANLRTQRNSDSFTYTADIEVKTTDNDYDYDSSRLTPEMIRGPGGIQLYNPPPELIVSVQDDGMVKLTITFSWDANQSYAAEKTLIIRRGNQIISTHTLSAASLNTITFSDVLPEMSRSVEYDINVFYPTLNINNGSSKLRTSYTVTPVSKALDVQFGGNRTSIPRSPAGTHPLSLTYLLPYSQSGSAISEIKPITVTNTDSKTWSQSFTLGHSAYSRARVYTYNWGDAEQRLQDGTSHDLSSDYHQIIPLNGLERTRTLTVKEDGAVVFRQSFTIAVTGDTSAIINPPDYMQIIWGDNQASYLQNTNEAKRTRLNTLFALELVSRARAGLDNILSWETQQLQEPILGGGAYVDVFIPACQIPEYAVYLVNDHPRINYPLAKGKTSGEAVTLKLHIPDGNVINATYAFLKVDVNGKNYSEYKKFFSVTYNPQGGISITPPDSQYLDGQTVSVSLIQTEPMDFSGANGLYFWELFYYSPMMAAEKLLQSQDFEGAERWLNYVFNPAGYQEREKYVDRQWNTRPLEEDTAWDDTQTDSTDPDVVAQADPMHYKVATLMKLLDILIARGDMAYRQLERDTLSEAKMWYQTALQLLGPQPDVTELVDWGDPTLGVAASKTVEQQSLMLMERLMLGDVRPLVLPAEQPQWEITQGDAQAEMSGENSPATRTANSLTALFLPCENDKLKGYWQTLAQRMFNLRHNLSIDGQPLTLPLFAPPADPKALQTAAAAASAGGASSLPNAHLSILRFPQILASARELVGLLTQYGGALSSVLERKDAEALDVMLQTQAQNLYDFGLQVIEQNLLALDEEQSIVEIELEQQKATMQRMAEYYDENASPAELAALRLKTTASTLQLAKEVFEVGSAGLKAIPNIFGLAMGGSDFSSFMDLGWKTLDLDCNVALIRADVMTTSEAWRRRREEWKAERDAAERQIRIRQAQLRNIDIQKQAQELQKAELEQQQANTQAHYDFLTTKFSNEALYSWMQGRLSALYYQLYDLSIARCLKAQLGFQWETGSSATFIRPGAWDSNHAGLLCGESLMLNLAQMESAYLEWDARTLEVRRTVSMAQEMGLSSAAFNDLVNGVLDDVKMQTREQPHILTLDDGVFRASIDLKSLNIADDYPNSVVTRSRYRLIKQVSVSLPALLGPYQDIQAVLGYSVGGGSIHPSCLQTAISHGSNDSGQFQLDFNDSKYLPFEGLPIDGSDNASLTLSFPNAGNGGKQRVILQSLNDIVLHISYTIRD